MELDELKTAWQALDRRLDQQHALNVEIHRASRLDKMHSGLRPLARGQVIQIILAALLVVSAAMFWTSYRDSVALFLAGVILHVYGISLIICAARTLHLISAIDYAAPVLGIQQQLSQLRHWYLRSGLALGLPWWLLWMPILMLALKAAFGVDIYANAPSVIWIGSAIGVAGLFGTLVLYRWAQQPGRSKFAKALADSSAGRSIVRAQAVADELQRFSESD